MATDDDDCRSPASGDDSFDDSFTYSTPITSPEASPKKRDAEFIKTATLEVVPFQLDGGVQDASESKSEDGNFRQAFSTLYLKKHGSQHASSKLKVRPHSLSASRKRQLAKRGLNHLDRFVPGRYQTPTKERLMLSKPQTVTTTTESSQIDPFAPEAGSAHRSNQYFTVTRYPAPDIRSHGLSGTSVSRGGRMARSALDLGTTWTAGRFPVTEGIASTTDGRGGRITSGTNAPLYNANMLFANQKVDDQKIHDQRLAVAMELDNHSKIIKVDSTLAGNSQHPVTLDDMVAASEKTVWKDSRWYTNRALNAKKIPSKQVKNIPVLPFKVLDAPELRNDYYCSLLAYSPTLDCIAVGLANHIFLWIDRKANRPVNISSSLMFPNHYGHVTSLSFSSGSGGKSILAIGCADGHLTLWNPQERAARLSCDQPMPISNVCFRPCSSRRQSARDPQVMVDTEELLVGTENGNVLLYSVEWPDQDQCDLFDWSRSMILRSIISCNTQQICGIVWTADGDSFATGGNDNQLFVFDFNKVERREATSDNNLTSPIRSPSEVVHARILPGREKQLFTLNAAVKAIAFAPWQSSLLAARGGSNDRCIHFLHTTSGATLTTINCHAQVTSLVWNRHRREIAATLGFAQPDHPFRVVVFAWPTCEQLTSIPWPGEERALYGISYPGCEQNNNTDCIVVATSDHSIKFHDIWPTSRTGSKLSARYAKSQILNDICSEGLENELQIR